MGHYNGYATYTYLQSYQTYNQAALPVEQAEHIVHAITEAWSTGCLATFTETVRQMADHAPVKTALPEIGTILPALDKLQVELRTASSQASGLGEKGTIAYQSFSKWIYQRVSEWLGEINVIFWRWEIVAGDKNLAAEAKYLLYLLVELAGDMSALLNNILFSYPQLNAQFQDSP